MFCCGKKDAEASPEEKNDKDSAKSVEEDEEEIDPDALQTWQVITAVAMLCFFSLSFATSFFLLSPAIHSLDANFDNRTYMCIIDNIVEDRNVSCIGYKLKSTCMEVMLRCEGFNDSKIMYKYYQYYYNTHRCSETRCREVDHPKKDSSGQDVKYPMSFIRHCCTANSTVYNPTSYPVDTPEYQLYTNMTLISAEFHYDKDKPEAMFFKRDESGTNNILLSKGAAYVIIILPMLFMGAIAITLITLFVMNKLTAKEIYRPLTPITSMHKKIKGKWYIKEPNSKEQPKMNAFEKLQNIKRQQEMTTSSVKVQSSKT